MNSQKLISYEWAIAIYKGDSPFNLKPIKDRPEAFITFQNVSDVAANFVADPFMIFKDGLWYMFFEVLNRSTGLGEIGYAISNDAVHWDYKNIILRQDSHLSYPFIFKNEDAIYMIPETRQAGEIRLYRASSFPDKWEQVKVMLKGNYADTTITKHKDRWWMFTLKGTKNLDLYYSDSIFGKWLPHANNPVIENDLKISRPAGGMIKYKDKLYRLAQDGVPLYGNKVRAFEVIEMDEDQYVEREIEESPILMATRKGWNSIGMHHIDAHQINDSYWIACVDGAKPKLKNLNR